LGAEDPDEPTEGEILVVAERLRGQVDGPQPPIVVLDEADIAAYGAGSIAELVEQLAPQTGSGRGRGGGRPVFLVNGMRVSSFREMRSYPPEAIRRVEVLPEETALRYGFAADQRVINFILKDNFSSRELELEYEQPDRGGYSGKEVELTYLNINGPSRLNLNLEWSDTSLLTEAERGVVQSPGSIPGVAVDPDPAAYRSLVPDSADLEVTANWSTKLDESGSSLSLNGTVERSDSRSLSGLNTVILADPAGDSVLRSFGADTPLERRSRTMTYSLGSALNTQLGDWQMTATLDASRSEKDTEIDRRADTSALVAAAVAGELDITGPLPDVAAAGFDEARSVSDSASSLVTLIGTPLYLPAGALSVTADAGYSWNRIQSRDTRNPGVETSLTRGELSAGVNLGVPIASRRDDAWAWLGDFSLNFSAGVDHLSDFGTLTDWTAGAVWGVTDNLSLQASYIARDAAPGLSLLGSPEIITLNVPVYDFARGETVLVTTTSGGNAALRQEKQRDLRIAAMWDLPFLERSNLMVEYFRNRSEDVAITFPLLTPAIETAFPDRVTRDANGRLQAIDQRPITIDRQDSSRLKFGLNLSGSLGSEERQRGNARGDDARAGDARGGGGRFMGRRGGGGNGRWFTNLSYSLELENTAIVAPGVPRLDLLDGDALSGGGTSRHSAELEGGLFYRGMGLRLSGTYSGPSRVDGSGLPGSSDLRFGSLATVDLRLFADLGQQESLVEKAPFLSGSRISFRIDNLFDARRRVTDQNGEVPLSYQPFLVDPTGRYLGIEFRKMF